MSGLTTEAVAPLEVSLAPPTSMTVTFGPTPIQDDAYMDLETGEIRTPTKAPAEPSEFSYKLKPSTMDHEIFIQTVAASEAPLWDREKVHLHADLFYHAYFQDFQLMSDLKQKAQARIQSFNVRDTRQDNKNDSSSTQANKQRLEAKFRTAINQMYKAFEDHLVKPAISQISSLFTSSRYRMCYSVWHQTTAWRRSRFDTLAPLLCEIPNEAYKKAEDHQAVVILEKTRMEVEGPPSDRYKLGLSEDDRRIYAALTRLERDSFNEELKNLININSLIRMLWRWESQKDNPPSLEVSLNYVHSIGSNNSAIRTFCPLHRL